LYGVHRMQETLIPALRTENVVNLMAASFVCIRLSGRITSLLNTHPLLCWNHGWRDVAHTY